MQNFYIHFGHFIKVSGNITRYISREHNHINDQLQRKLNVAGFKCLPHQKKKLRQNCLKLFFFPDSSSMGSRHATG